MDVILPKWGVTMEDAVIDEWQVEVGTVVQKGQVLVTVETDKAIAEVEAPVSGRIEEILASSGETVPVGAVIAHIKAES